MTAFRILIATSLISTLPIGTAFAQADPASTQGGVLSTERAPNTTAVGQTKPPSRDASPTAIKPIERPTAEQVATDAIAAQVCVGCNTESASAETLNLRIRPPVSPEVRGGPPDDRIGQRDTSLGAVAPKQQSDLDTVALASAHRERAESVKERTDGLWQSWLVSVCNGCGDQKPARALKVQDWPDRAGPATTGSVARPTKPVAARHDDKPAASHPHGSLEADLSPENVNSIRRMPQP